MEKDRRKEILKIHIRRDLTVDYEQVNVRMSTGDEVEWHTDEVPVTISFDADNTPFKSPSFDVAPGVPVRSGPPVGGLGDYNYYIRNEALAMSADPGVSIKP